MWWAGTCVIVGDFIITGIDEESLTKNCLVKLDAFRGATSVDINHHIQISMKKLDVIILHVGIVSLEHLVRSLMICCNLRVSLQRSYQTGR